MNKLPALVCFLFIIAFPVFAELTNEKIEQLIVIEQEAQHHFDNEKYDAVLDTTERFESLGISDKELFPKGMVSDYTERQRIYLHIFWLRAQSYSVLERYREGIECFERIYRNFRITDRKFLSDFALCLHCAGENTRALEVLYEALGRVDETELSQIYWNLTWIEYEEGNHETCISLAEESIDLDSGVPGPALNASLAASAIGNIEQAYSYFYTGMEQVIANDEYSWLIDATITDFTVCTSKYGDQRHRNTMLWILYTLNDEGEKAKALLPAAEIDIWYKAFHKIQTDLPLKLYKNGFYFLLAKDAKNRAVRSFNERLYSCLDRERIYNLHSIVVEASKQYKLPDVTARFKERVDDVVPVVTWYWVYNRWGKNDDIKRNAFEELLAALRKADLFESKYAVIIIGSLSYYYEKEKEYEKADGLRKGQLFIVQEWHPSGENEYYMSALRSLAHIAEERGKYDEAEWYYRKLVRIWKETGRWTEDENYVYTLDNLALLYWKMERGLTSLRLFEEVAEICKQWNPIGRHWRYKRALRNIAEIYRIFDRTKKAEEVEEELKKIEEK